jgi:hypothetical protein
VTEVARPNVDIRWSLHGRLKEYAQREDCTVEEAYEMALMEGLPLLEESYGGDHR